MSTTEQQEDFKVSLTSLNGFNYQEFLAKLAVVLLGQMLRSPEGFSLERVMDETSPIPAYRMRAPDGRELWSFSGRTEDECVDSLVRSLAQTFVIYEKQAPMPQAGKTDINTPCG